MKPLHDSVGFSHRLGAFWTREDGAVTADYVVLLGGIVGVGITVVAEVKAGLDTLSTKIATEIASIEVDPYAEIAVGGSSGGDGSSGGASSGGSGGSSAGSGGTGSSGSGSGGGTGGGDTGSGGSGTGGLGNPGNDKNVGKAGENPNGKGGWGSGSKGKSR